ncbi:hydroquinone glucosyltransferase-like [Diospyros lotus]|uniref:hydroquinone glucosyltransferase-like n=1 Tax=Diospyros lotus TaxID=55363 RepID=UPI00225AFA4F|nr:hydroquinone glucosyltransferase-like [Diospyros lotus]
MGEAAPHIAVLPSPGMSHLISLGEFAKRLVQKLSYSVTIILPTYGPLSGAQKSFLDSLPAGISHLILPAISLDDLPPSAGLETRISLTVSRSLPVIRDALKSLTATTNLAALVVDVFGTDTFDVAREFNVSPYVYFLSTAMSLSVLFHLQTLDETVSCEFREMKEPVQIPGVIPFHGRDLLYPVQDRKNDTYKWFLHHAKRYHLAEGIMINTCRDLEPGPIKALQQPGKPPIYPIGPIIQVESGGGADGSKCLQWLDKQPSRSVLFVSFGSGGTLSHEQITELALGLELSGQRFLWVAKAPDKSADGAYFTAESLQSDPLAFLPKGFVERTKDRGFVITTWAPQIQVLGHGSTGGFLTHCGWNSILENILHGHGVPFIAWPLFAEQNMNAVLVTDDLKVAVRPKAGEKGLVGREEIAKVATAVIAGDEAGAYRQRMKELKGFAVKTLGEDGDSTKALYEVANKWKNH